MRIRTKTAQAFAEWINDEENVAEVLERIAGGLTLQKASVALKQPYTCLHGYFHSSPELTARYEGARKAWVDFKNDVLLEKVEGVAPDRDQVAKLKLEADVISNQSKAYHRDRWGEKLRVEKTVDVVVDAGPATRLLREMRALEEKEAVPMLPHQVHENTSG